MTDLSRLSLCCALALQVASPAVAQDTGDTGSPSPSWGPSFAPLEFGGLEALGGGSPESGCSASLWGVGSAVAPAELAAETTTFLNKFGGHLSQAWQVSIDDGPLASFWTPLLPWSIPREVTAELPGGVCVEFGIVDYDTVIGERTLWMGQSTGNGNAATLVTVGDEQGLRTASVATSAATYVVWDRPGGAWLVEYWTEDEGDDVELSTDPPEYLTEDVFHQPYDPSLLPVPDTTRGRSPIDVLVAVTPEVVSEAGSMDQVLDTVALGIGWTNLGLATAQSNNRMRLLAFEWHNIGTAVGCDRESVSEDFLRHTNTCSTVDFSLVWNNREVVGADLLWLLADDDIPQGALIMGGRGSVPIDRGRVLRDADDTKYEAMGFGNASPSTTMHEWGHGMGANHDPGSVYSTGTSAAGDNWCWSGGCWDQGFVFGGGTHRTVMSYDDDCTKTSCPEVPVYSNPLVTRWGTAGFQTHQNNSMVVRTFAPMVSRYRSPSIHPTPWTSHFAKLGDLFKLHSEHLSVEVIFDASATAAPAQIDMVVSTALGDPGSNLWAGSLCDTDPVTTQIPDCIPSTFPQTHVFDNVIDNPPLQHGYLIPSGEPLFVQLITYSASAEPAKVEVGRLAGDLPVSCRADPGWGLAGGLSTATCETAMSTPSSACERSNSTLTCDGTLAVGDGAALTVITSTSPSDGYWDWLSTFDNTSGMSACCFYRNEANNNFDLFSHLTRSKTLIYSAPCPMITSFSTPAINSCSLREHHSSYERSHALATTLFRARAITTRATQRG